MADWTIADLTTAVVGSATTVNFKVQSTAAYAVEVSNGTVSIGNVTFGSFAVPGWLTGRRPLVGEVFPRGVYNK